MKRIGWAANGGTEGMVRGRGAASTVAVDRAFSARKKTGLLFIFLAFFVRCDGMEQTRQNIKETDHRTAKSRACRKHHPYDHPWKTSVFLILISLLFSLCMPWCCAKHAQA